MCHDTRRRCIKGSRRIVVKLSKCGASAIYRAIPANARVWPASDLPATGRKQILHSHSCRSVGGAGPDISRARATITVRLWAGLYLGELRALRSRTQKLAAWIGCIVAPYVHALFSSCRCTICQIGTHSPTRWSTCRLPRAALLLPLENGARFSLFNRN